MRVQKKLIAYLLIVFCYVISGKAALMLALPPGYASPIFPPAGIAVAAALIGGRKTLPWIFLGSLLLNIWIGYSGTHQINGMGLVIATIIAVASTLQAAIGGWILRRMSGYPAASGKGRDILHLLPMLPLICLISASFSVTGLLALGIIDLASFTPNWLAWWIGDTLGVVTMFPIAMVVAGEPRALWRNRVSSIAVPVLMVLLTGFVAIYFLQQAAFDAARQHQQTNFDAVANEITLRIEQRLAAYEEVLRGAQGLFAASRSVERSEFRDYVDSLQLTKHYPGIQGIGFSPLVPKHEKIRLVEMIHKDGFSDFKVWPAGDRNMYAPIIYLEPFAGSNLRAFGYDVYAEAVRRSALERARDQDNAALTGKLRLVQETDQDMQTGFIMYLPVYRNGKPHETLADRRTNTIGWVSSPFRTDDLMQGILGNLARKVDLEIFDGGNAMPEALMYDSRSARHHTNTPMYTTFRHLDIAGHSWTIKLHSLPVFESEVASENITAIRLGGIPITLLLALLVLQLASGRERALNLAQEMTHDLRVSGEALKEAQRLARIGSWHMDIATGQVYWSEMLYEMYGFDPALPPPPYAESMRLFTPESWEKLSTAIAQTAETGRPFELELEMVKPDGGRGWMLGRGELVRDDRGTAVNLRGVVMDITERKTAELQLKQSEELWSFALEGAGDGVWDWNVSNGKVTLSKAGAAMFGFEQSEAAHDIADWYARLLPEDQVRWQEMLRRFFLEKADRFLLEYRVRCNDGNYIWILTRGMVVSRSADGKVVRMIGVHTDITQRKHAEIAVQQSAERIQMLLDSVAEGIYGVDMQGNCTFINSAGLRLLGYQRETDLLGKNMHAMIHHTRPDGSHYPMEECRLYRSMQSQEDVHVSDEVFWRKDGSSFPIDYWSRPTLLDGKQGAVITFVDIAERKQAEEALRKSAEEIQDLYNHAPCGYHSLDKDGVIIRINDTELNWLGYTRDEVVEKMKFTDLLTPASCQAFQKAFPQIKKRGALKDVENELVCKDDSILRGLTNSIIVYDVNDEYLACRSTVFDITERKKTEDTLRSLFTAIEHSPIAVIITDESANINYVSPRFSEITGYLSSDVIGRNLRIMQAERIEKLAYLEMWDALASGRTWHGELLSKTKQGRSYWDDIHVTPVKTLDGSIANYVLVSADVTERKAAEKQMQHLATFDPLTDLPNRSLVDDRMHQALVAAKRDKTRMALMFLDLDKFKPINDTLGHDVGDLLLIEAAKRMRECVRESDTVGRIGGDEFVVLLPTVDSDQDAVLVAEKIRHALSQPFVLAGHELHISSSIGISIHPEHGDDNKTLTKNADTAMYYAKERGRNNVCLFNPEMVKSTR